MGRLSNKVALVTGAARGIGLAVAQLFAEKGATVVLSDINDELGEQEVSQMGASSLYRHLDVSNEEQWERLSDELLGLFGRVDVLVNNAGITGFLETKGAHDPENLDLIS